MNFIEIIPLLIEGKSLRRRAFRDGLYIKFAPHKDPFYEELHLCFFCDEQDEYIEIYRSELDDFEATDWEINEIS